MNMTKVVVKIEKDFTVIPNEIIRNKKMSANAKMILITMLSLPPEWDFSINGLTSCVKEGRDTVRNALIEIEKFGYVTRERERKENGTLGAMIYTVYQYPVDENLRTYKPKLEKPTQAKPTLENNEQYNTLHELNKKEENTDNELSIDKYAFSDKSSKESNMYASVSEKQEGEQKPKKKSRFITKDYTEEQLIEHIKPVIDNYIDENCERQDKDELKNNLLEIIMEFHREYEKKFGEKHRILADVSYENIAERFLNPPDILDTVYDVESYSAMIEQYFIVEFNKRKKYKKPIEISLSHFMSDEIRGHLYWQTCV